MNKQTKKKTRKKTRKSLTQLSKVNIFAKNCSFVGKNADTVTKR